MGAGSPGTNPTLSANHTSSVTTLVAYLPERTLAAKPDRKSRSPAVVLASPPAGSEAGAVKAISRQHIAAPPALRSRPPLARGAFYGLCGAPLCQELRDERVLVIRVDSQGCQRERHRDSGVIAERPRRDGARIRGMGVVDPDRVVNQPAEFRIAGSGFKMHQQSVPRRPSATGDGVEGSCRCRMRMRLTLCGRREAHSLPRVDLPAAEAPGT